MTHHINIAIKDLLSAEKALESVAFLMVELLQPLHGSSPCLIELFKIHRLVFLQIIRELRILAWIQVVLDSEDLLERSES